MNLINLYLSRINPLLVINRLLHPYNYTELIKLNGNTIKIKWTKRANEELLKRQLPLIIELQLHFACLVKKQVLFHSKANVKATQVTNNLAITFRAVQSVACGSLNQDYQIKKVLTSDAAMKMHPTILQFDYRQKNWLGEYYI